MPDPVALKRAWDDLEQKRRQFDDVKVTSEIAKADEAGTKKAFDDLQKTRETDVLASFNPPPATATRGEGA